MSEGARIVVVHSSPDTTVRLRESLKAANTAGFAGVEVISAATLAEASRELAAFTPKVIFLGLTLADSGGLATLRAVRRECKAAPIIVLVEEDDHVGGAAAIRSGAQDYLDEMEARSDVIQRAMIRAIGRRQVEEEHADTGWRSGIGETALGVRHEINNPLAALMLNLEMLKEGGHEDADEMLQGIEIAAKRIAAVVRRLEGLKTPQRIPAIGGKAMVDLSGGDEGPKAERKSGGGGEATQGGSTILLVDDEESVRAIVTKILSRHGHNVLEAEHGADALRLAAGFEGKIDLLITDMYMPGLRGPEILEKLKPTRPGLPVLFMSGYGDEDVARSGVEPGSSFLRKPFTVQELSEAVRKALSGESKA